MGDEIRVTRHFFPLFLALCLLPLGTVAQEFPTRPVRIVTSEAGGGNDVQARVIARGLTGVLGQQVIVENRPSGVIPADPKGAVRPATRPRAGHDCNDLA